MIYNSVILLTCLILINRTFVSAKKFKEEEKPAWAKKDIRHYTDADLERLLDQWEEDEEPLDPDELPEHLRPQPKIDISKLSSSNPENILKLTKKGRTLMVFVSVGDNPTRDETEHLTKLWHGSLWNSHIQSERYVIDDDRVIFMFKDGSQAWDAKEYLITQERCKVVSIENQNYYGKYYPQEEDAAKDKEKKPKVNEEL